MFRPLSLAIALACTLTLGHAASAQEYLQIKLKSGVVTIELFDDIAPNHVARVKKLAKGGAYDGIAFHRVIPGFMTQTGDVQYGKLKSDGSVSSRAGFGGSKMADLRAEFSEIKFRRGVVGAARGGGNPDSANSQFFIMLEDKLWMNDPRDARTFYTVWGCVLDGIEHVDNIKTGDPQSGSVKPPVDGMIKVTVTNKAPVGGSCRP